MSKWHPHTLGQLPYAVERLEGVLSCLTRPWVDVLTLTKVFMAVMLLPIIDEALGGHQGFFCLDKLLVIAALLPPQWASPECGAVCANCLSKFGDLVTSRFNFLNENVNKFWKWARRAIIRNCQKYLNRD